MELSFTPSSPKKLNTVFIVDDNSTERSMMTDFFSRYPELTVKEFANGNDCVKEMVMSGATPEIILLDYFLDGEIADSRDGLEILVKLKELSPSSTIIMHTGVDNPRIIELARKKGAFSYIVKGADSFKTLERILEKEFVLNAAS